MTSDMREVDAALNTSRTASEALMSATVIGEQKKADLDNRLSASATAIDDARKAREELEAELKKRPHELRVLQDKAATTNEKWPRRFLYSLKWLAQLAAALLTGWIKVKNRKHPAMYRVKGAFS